MPRAANTWAPVMYDRIDFKGGLDQLTPTLNLPPGVLRSAQNFEISITGGYARIAGYERFDGRPSPSATSYSVFTISAFGTLAAGTLITGATSGTTATVANVNTIGLNNFVAYVQTSGTGFLVGEAIQVSAVTQGTVVSITTGVGDAYTLALFAAGAADVQRANIGKPTGSGNILGGFYLNGTCYCFRANAGGTAVNLFKSTTGGWVQVTFGYELKYNNGVGTPTFTAGATVTGLVSGATGTIAATIGGTASVINETGVVVSGVPTWAGSSGRFILSATSGSFTAGEALQIGGVTVANYAGTTGALSAITLSPGGKFTADVVAFGGGTVSTNVAYGADGVNRCWSFDGAVFVPINTGNSPDTPRVIRKHLQYLVVGIQNSLQLSGLGLPFQWSPLVGGAEILMPENITDIIPLPGNQATGALVIFSQNYTNILYGSTTNTFQLVPYNIKSGCYLHCAANLSDTYVFETRGVASMTTTLQYGNFDPSYLTMPNKPFIDAHQQFATCAMVDREKSQYRIFFSDGFGLYCTLLNKQFTGCIPISFPDPVLNIWDGTDPVTGQQVIFFGSTSGYVFQQEKGTSFDGQSIQAFLQFVYDSKDSHRMLKRYRKMSLEITGTLYCTFSVSYTLGYASALIGQPNSATYTVPFTQAYWDNFTWDNFTWDGVNLAPREVEVAGTAENIAFYILSNTNLLQPFTINTATVHYTPRRGLR